MSKKAKTTKTKKATKSTKKEKRLDTGYVAAIRNFLQKQKYTVSAVAEKIHEQFPDKDVASIKRVASNVAKRARKEDPTLRWLPSAATNTGYMARIDELLFGQKHTTRQVAEIVTKEFDKDPISAKKVVRARLKRLRDQGKKVKPPLEADIREKAPKKTKATPKAGKGKKATKTAAKPRKKTGKAKKTQDEAAPEQTEFALQAAAA